MASFVENHPTKADLYALITYQSQGGTVGIAWSPPVCDPEESRKYRMSMNAWFNSDQVTGKVCIHSQLHEVLIHLDNFWSIFSNLIFIDNCS